MSEERAEYIENAVPFSQVVCPMCGSLEEEHDITFSVKLDKILKEEAKILTRKQARYLVDMYYQMQRNRIRAKNQEKAALENEEPPLLVGQLSSWMIGIENSIKSAMGFYTDNHYMGKWCKSIMGIGPVLAAGLIAHIDIERAETAGQIWRYAGLDPTMEWKKGQKRPFNASLKVVCWKIGESFVKVSNNPKDVYGKIYAARKVYETEKNDAGDYEEYAKTMLEKFNYGKTTDAYKAYKAGRLPKGHIHERAKRYAVKMFLSHFHEVAYRNHYKKEPPKPFVIEHLGHAHMIKPPMMLE